MSWKEIEVSRDWTHFIQNGQPLFPGKYLSVLKFKGVGLAPVKDRNGWHFINSLGKVQIAGPFYQAWGFYCGLSAVEDASGCYHIDEAGVPAYGQRYDWCGNFQENRCAVRGTSGNYFHIYKNGKRVYPKNYRYVGDYKDGIACVMLENGRFKHLDESGEYLYALDFFEIGLFHKGLATVRDAQGWMHIDLRGEPQYDARFAAIEPFYNNCAFATDLSGNKVVLTHSRGAFHFRNL